MNSSTLDSNATNDKTEIKTTLNKGRGVFAKQKIFKNEIFETCQTITFSEEDAEKIESTFLGNYWFGWTDDPKNWGAIALGNGSLYNHSIYPNAKFIKDFEHGLIYFVALEDIPIGDEITVKYGIVWFKEVEEEKE